MASLTDRVRDRAMQGERLGWRLAARLVFIAVVVVLTAVIIMSDSRVFMIFAAVVLGLLLRAVLPTQQIQSVARSYWSGEAGERWRQRAHAVWTRLTFWR